MTERGERGDTGQTGLTGAEGIQGETGTRGRPGRSLTQTQTLVVITGVVLTFALLALRSENQDRRIIDNQRDIARTQYTECVGRNDIATQHNALLDSTISLQNRLAHPDQQRIRELISLRLGTFDCGSRPK
jgi:hypothetical protein